jgi:hypothetical protein
MEIKLHQGDLVNLMTEHISQNGKSSRGTYNRADPTAYEKGEAKFELMYGYSQPLSNPWPDCDHDQDDPPCKNCKNNDPIHEPPSPEVVTASYHDCTWGVRFTFRTSMGPISAYYDRPNRGDQDGEWVQVEQQGIEGMFERVFKDILFADPEGTNFGEECARVMGSEIV